MGQHAVAEDGEDLLFLHIEGDVSADEARQLVVLDRAQARRNGYSLVLIDGTRLTNFGAAARKAAFEEVKRYSGYLGSTGIYGLSGPMMWLMRLVLRGLILLASYIDDEVQIFSTEAEAREFLNRRRSLRQRQVAQRRST